MALWPHIMQKLKKKSLVSAGGQISRFKLFVRQLSVWHCSTVKWIENGYENFLTFFYYMICIYAKKAYNLISGAHFRSYISSDIIVANYEQIKKLIFFNNFVELETWICILCSRKYIYSGKMLLKINILSINSRFKNIVVKHENWDNITWTVHDVDFHIRVCPLYRNYSFFMNRISVREKHDVRESVWVTLTNLVFHPLCGAFRVAICRVQNVALTSSLLSADGRREGGGGGGKSARALPFKMRPSSSLG